MDRNLTIRIGMNLSKMIFLIHIKSINSGNHEINYSVLILVQTLPGIQVQAGQPFELQNRQQVSSHKHQFDVCMELTDFLKVEFQLFLV
jgi:hypothetical protein